MRTAACGRLKLSLSASSTSLPTHCRLYVALGSNKGPNTAHACRFDPELWVHEQLVALQCDDDMRAAAHAHDRTLSPSERYPPSLFNARLPFLPGGVDLMRVYEYAHFPSVLVRCCSMLLIPFIQSF